MSQTNSSPGAHPPSGVIAVAPAESHGGTATIVAARAVAVPYSQNEPGTHKQQRM